MILIICELSRCSSLIRGWGIFYGQKPLYLIIFLRWMCYPPVNLALTFIEESHGTVQELFENIGIDAEFQAKIVTKMCR